MASEDAPELLSAANYIRIAGQLADAADAWATSFSQNYTTEFQPQDYDAISAAFARIGEATLSVANILQVRTADSQS